MSEIEIPFLLRSSSAKRFHNFRAKNLDSNWLDILEEIDANENYGLPELLVLLDPKYYAQIGAKDPRGDRTFGPTTQNSRCRSLEIWGYTCPYLANEIHIDHVFPQSRGGLTHPLNAMYLCREHNLAKHTDVHLIPWEMLVERNSWIELALGQLITAAQRFTTLKLFMPTKQLGKL